jgi:hypothetical protein
MLFNSVIGWFFSFAGQNGTPAILDVGTIPQTQTPDVLKDRSTFAAMESTFPVLGNDDASSDGKIRSQIAILRPLDRDAGLSRGFRMPRKNCGRQDLSVVES